MPGIVRPKLGFLSRPKPARPMARLIDLEEEKLSVRRKHQAAGAAKDDVLCEHFERTVRKDNGVQFSVGSPVAILSVS